MALTLGIACGAHDASASLHDGYDLLAAVQLERLTRIKGDGRRLPWEAVDEVLSIAGQTRQGVKAIALMRGHIPRRYFTFPGRVHAFRRAFQSGWDGLSGREGTASMQQELRRAGANLPEGLFRRDQFLAEHGFSPETIVYFFNHHEAHALPALFYNPDWDDALLYTADGGGDWTTASHRVFRDGEITILHGGEEAVSAPRRVDSVALAYGYATTALGYRINRHEGKLTGLAARGEPVLHAAMAAPFRLTDDGKIKTSLKTNRDLKTHIHRLARGHRPEDVAASVQLLIERLTIGAVNQLLRQYPSRNLGLSGGLFANVLLNQKLLEETPADRIFIDPAMTDAGLCVGGALQYLLRRDGAETWLSRRRRLVTLFLGRDHTTALNRRLNENPAIVQTSPETARAAADALAAGQAVGLFDGRMEWGPRALGNRSILASPADPAISTRLNARLGREEFMPFAPAVLEDDADRVFDLAGGARYPARFMTITCPVRAEWRPRIPAIVHVDGTARPQIVRPSDHPLFAGILNAFKARTGLPVLINTSFNIHEEPVIDGPDDAIVALLAGRVNYLAAAHGLFAAS